MLGGHLEDYLDLRRADIDPEMFASALAVRHVHKLLVHGGSPFRYPDLETALQPHHLEAFLARAVETAQKTKRFEHEWQRLQRFVPRLKIAWKKGQVLFQEDLIHARESDEAMDYLSQIDFATDCYAYASASRTYPNDPALIAWAMNGYLLAWWQHFSEDKEDSSS